MKNTWHGKRVLIVGDEEVVAIDLTQQFESLGLVVCATARTASDALTHAETLRPDLISMDINLGASGEGIAAVTLLGMSDLETPVLFITGGVEPDSGDQIRSLGRAEYVSKPFGRETLKEGLRRLQLDVEDAG